MSYTDAFANSQIDAFTAQIAAVGLAVGAVEVTAAGYARVTGTTWGSATSRSASTTSDVSFTVTEDAGTPDNHVFYNSGGTVIGYSPIAVPVALNNDTLLSVAGEITIGLPNTDGTPAS